MVESKHYGFKETVLARILEREHEKENPEHEFDVFLDRNQVVHTNCLDCWFGVVAPLLKEVTI